MDKVKIYKDSYSLLILIYRSMNEMPRRERFSIGTKMTECSLAMLDSITLAYQARAQVDRLERMNGISPTPSTLEDFRAIINSYLGFMKNRATYNIRKRLIATINDTWMKYIDVSGDLVKVTIKDEYLKRNITKQKLINQKLCNKKKLTRSIREYTNANSFSV